LEKKKQINQENNSKQNIYQLKECKPNLKTNKKNQMIRDEIENKIQIEIINVNKTIANKRRETRSKEKIN
jgi:site-specific DNA-adenine methylase